jgi:Flp pilus assembly protein TadD
MFLCAVAALAGAPAMRADPPAEGESLPVAGFQPEATPAPDVTAPAAVSGTVMRTATASRLSPAAKAAAEAGIEALGKNNFDGAEKAFLQLLKLSPENPSALVNLGLVEVRLGRPDDAKKYLARAIRVAPDAALAWTTLGLIYQNEDDAEGATAALAQAVYLDPKSPQAHNYFAVTLAKRGWYDAAEEELQKAVELAPDFAEAQYNLALVYFQRHPPAVELARRHYQKALDLGAAPDPDFEAKLNAAPAQNEVQ